MNEKNLSCGIVRDLIPLCSEELCSEESRTAIEEHIRDCEGCRRLYGQLPEITEPESAVPDEGSAFRKVNRLLKHRLLKIIILILVLTVLLAQLTLLTIGQVMKVGGQHSFETVWQSIEVRRLAKMIGTGDIDGYLRYASDGDLIDSMITPTEMEQLREQEREQIIAAYEEAYGWDKLDHIVIDSTYSRFRTAGTGVVDTVAMIFFDSGRELQIHFTKDRDGRYCGIISGTSVDSEYHDAEWKFSREFDYLSQHNLYPQGWLNGFLTNDQPLDEEGSRVRAEYLAGKFAPEWHDQIEEELTAFYQKGYLITDFIVTNVYYDQEQEMLYHELTLAAEDAQGSCNLMTRLYTNIGGMVPAPEMNRIFTNGCTDALAEDLGALFS